MLGSVSEAEDAVQEAWIRLSRTDVSGVDKRRGWLTTVGSRVCLDMLRSRASRRDDPLDLQVVVPIHVVLTELPAAVNDLAAIGEGTVRERGLWPLSHSRNQQAMRHVHA